MVRAERASDICARKAEPVRVRICVTHTHIVHDAYATTHTIYPVSPIHIVNNNLCCTEHNNASITTDNLRKLSYWCARVRCNGASARECCDINDDISHFRLQLISIKLPHTHSLTCSGFGRTCFDDHRRSLPFFAVNWKMLIPDRRAHTHTRSFTLINAGVRTIWLR